MDLMNGDAHAVEVLSFTWPSTIRGLGAEIHSCVVSLQCGTVESVHSVTLETSFNCSRFCWSVKFITWKASHHSIFIQHPKKMVPQSQDFERRQESGGGSLALLPHCQGLQRMGGPGAQGKIRRSGTTAKCWRHAMSCKLFPGHWGAWVNDRASRLCSLFSVLLILSSTFDSLSNFCTTTCQAKYS